ncbi:hypothetical protein DFJ73DRAFT_827471 [Zopfochytrium polystomum]|nr:hypothetical protein DFJ73DRAFT_827471 [Zopfochytrium polystomum]
MNGRVLCLCLAAAAAAEAAAAEAGRQAGASKQESAGTGIASKVEGAQTKPSLPQINSTHSLAQSKGDMKINCVDIEKQ